MSHSRNANMSWGEFGGIGNVRPSAERLRSKVTREPAVRPGTQRDEGFQPQGTAYRVACRLFPGFVDLPTAFRASIDGYAPLFLAESGPLTMREREVIALAVAGRDRSGFGADAASTDGDPVAEEKAPVVDGADEQHPSTAGSGTEREQLIAAFASTITQRWLAIGGSDVERLLDAGISVHEIRAIAEVATVFHFLAELSAAMRLRPRRGLVGGAPIAAVASRDPSWRELSRWLA